MPHPWYVKETPCYPCSFKVTYDLSHVKKDVGNNSFVNYFRTYDEAKIEADRRNNLEGK